MDEESQPADARPELDASSPRLKHAEAPQLQQPPQPDSVSDVLGAPEDISTFEDRYEPL
jgi:hypothetical protein